MTKSATIKEKFETVNWNEASKLGLVDKINEQVLHPIGMSITRNSNSGASPCILKNNGGEWEHENEYEINAFLREGVATFFDNGEPKLSKKQIDFLVKLNGENRSGSAPKKDSVKLAYTYFLDRDSWDSITKGKNGVTPQKKALGKALARRVIEWHNLLTNWPKTPREKLVALNNIGKKKVAENVIDAAVHYLETDDTMNKSASLNDCFMGSVKPTVAKIEKFDDAVKGYGEL